MVILLEHADDEPQYKHGTSLFQFPVDGGWSDWQDDGTCSATCGVGKLNQIRTCTNPPPSHGGLECNGNNTRTTDCNQQRSPGEFTKLSPSHDGLECKGKQLARRGLQST